MDKILTGIKPTGVFHLGNYASVIKPLLKFKTEETICLIADYHAITNHNISKINEYKKQIAIILYVYGLKNFVFQSDVPEIFELQWILNCYCAKGILNRAHGYKTLTEQNKERNKDTDKGVFMGLYGYPVLMTADLTIFDTNGVTIGKDQIQHIEMAKEIKNKFNHIFKTQILSVPEPIVYDTLVVGTDNKKMSKSYNNIIPLMCSEKKLLKLIRSYKTNCKTKGELKKYDESSVTSLFNIFATPFEQDMLHDLMIDGIDWKEVKDIIFKLINDCIKPKREQYIDLMNHEFIPKLSDYWYQQNKDTIQQKMKDVKKLIFS